MKFKLSPSIPFVQIALCALVIFSARYPASAATNDLAAVLQKGLFEEEANHNYSAAITAYESVVSRFDDHRKLAATAIFRLGEIYRKQGKTNEATAQYRRVVREFADQAEVANLSRPYLAVAGQAQAAPESEAGPAGSTALTEAQEIKRIQEMVKDSPDLINAGSGDLGRTLLHQAARDGRPIVAEFLLTHGADVEAKDQNGRTPLLVATENGQKGMVELLLSKNARVKATDNEGYTALHLAAQKGFKTVAEVLLAHGAEVNARAKLDRMPLHLALVSGFRSIAELLLVRGADPNGSSTYTPPLHIAAQRGDSAMTQLLLDSHAAVNSMDPTGETPLSAAAAEGHLEVARALLAHGAEVDLKGAKVATPLGRAIEKGQKEMARLLLQNQANPNARFDSLRQLPGRGMANVRNCTPLLLAVFMADAEMVEMLLANKADPNVAPDNFDAPIFHAIEFAGSSSNQLRILQALLNGGADVNARGTDGGTPLIAVRDRDPQLIQLLLAHKADVKARDKSGQSSLHWLALLSQNRNLTNQAELLLQAGADVNAIDNQGRTPLTCTRLGTFTGKAFAEMLLRHGAVKDMPDFSSIRVTRAADGPFNVLTRDTNGLNHFTLFEILGQYYLSSANPVLSFPDLSAVKILRPVPGKPGERREIPAVVLSARADFDCSRDQPLEFGDSLEIPEREHTLAEPATALTGPQRSSLEACIARKVTIILKDVPSEVVLQGYGNGNYLSRALRLPQVQSILRSTSDLSHVKVRRTNPAGGKTSEFTADVERFWKYPQEHPIENDLWLRQGDIVEIPDKT